MHCALVLKFELSGVNRHTMVHTECVLRDVIDAHLINSGMYLGCKWHAGSQHVASKRHVAQGQQQPNLHDVTGPHP